MKQLLLLSLTCLILGFASCKEEPYGTLIYDVKVTPDTVFATSSDQTIDAHPVFLSEKVPADYKWYVHHIDIVENGKVSQISHSQYIEKEDEFFKNPDNIKFKWITVKTNRDTGIISTHIKENTSEQHRELYLFVRGPFAATDTLYVRQAGRPARN